MELATNSDADEEIRRGVAVAEEGFRLRRDVRMA